MITAKSTCIEVSDYEWDSCSSIQYLFTMFDKTKHEYFYRGIEYIEEEKKLLLPRGMNLRLVEKLLNERVNVYGHKPDPVETTGPVAINYAPRGETQKETIKFILAKKEYEYTKVYSQLCINLMTGKGKTYVTIASIAYLEIKSLIVTALSGWINQWKQKILEYTDIKEKEILLLNRRVMTKILNDELNLDKYKTFLCSHKAISDYASVYGWKSISTLFTKLAIGIKVFDEAHLYFDNMAKIDLYTNTAKTLYLTASPHRSDRRDDEIYKIYFEMVPSIELFNKEEDAKTRYISFHFNSHPTPMQISNCRNMYGLNKPAYVDYIMGNPIFYKVMHILMNRVVDKVEGKVLMLFGKNDAILKMKEWICTNYPEYMHDIGVYYGNTPPDEREEAKKKKIILSNVQCAGTALDIYNLNATIIAAAPFASKVTAQQTFGRTGREGCTVSNMMYIDLVDEGFKKLKEFYTAKQPVFMKYATECSRILYRDFELNKEYDLVMANRKMKKLSVPVPFGIDPAFVAASIPFTIDPSFISVPVPFDIV